MKILVTGFQPFAGMEINPSEQLVQALQNENLENIELVTLTLPVVYDRCVEILIEKVAEVTPDAVICCGLAFGRASISIERIGINLKDTSGEGRMGDNNGNQPLDERINENGPDGVFSNLPLRAIEANLVKNNIPVEISNTAGTFICNNTLYGLLQYIKVNQLQIKAGFIHFPATPELTLKKPNTANMSFECQLAALKIIVKSLYAAKEVV